MAECALHKRIGETDTSSGFFLLMTRQVRDVFPSDTEI